jgi:hypothetical protein
MLYARRAARLASTVTVGLVFYRRLVLPKERQWTADLLDSVLKRGRINGDLLCRGRYRETHHSVCFGTGIQHHSIIQQWHKQVVGFLRC